MTIRVDPEGNETAALFKLLDPHPQNVLEIGSGDGRLTWRYADRVGHILALEPYGPSVEKAKKACPPEWKERIEFLQGDFNEVAAGFQANSFDCVLLSWTLCWMSAGGMVHALEEIHRLLKPDGCLIDIHPCADSAWLEVIKNGQNLFKEKRASSSGESYRQADEALAGSIQNVFFTLDSHGEFDYLVYGSNVQELRDYFAEIDAYESSPQDEEVSKNITAAFERADKARQEAGQGAEIATRETVHIARLVPHQGGISGYPDDQE